MTPAGVTRTHEGGDRTGNKAWVSTRHGDPPRRPRAAVDSPARTGNVGLRAREISPTHARLASPGLTRPCSLWRAVKPKTTRAWELLFSRSREGSGGSPAVIQSCWACPRGAGVVSPQQESLGPGRTRWARGHQGSPSLPGPTCPGSSVWVTDPVGRSSSCGEGGPPAEQLPPRRPPSPCPLARASSTARPRGERGHSRMTTAAENRTLSRASPRDV